MKNVTYKNHTYSEITKNISEDKLSVITHRFIKTKTVGGVKFSLEFSAYVTEHGTVSIQFDVKKYWENGDIEGWSHENFNVANHAFLHLISKK